MQHFPAAAAALLAHNIYTLLCVLFMKFFRLKTLGLFSYSHDSGKKAIKANMTALI